MVFAATKVAVQITNQSGGPIAVNWVNPTSRDTVLMFNLMSGAETGMDSFYSHEFEIRELPNQSGECGSDADMDTSCKTGNFRVTEKSQQCKYVLRFNIVMRSCFVVPN